MTKTWKHWQGQVVDGKFTLGEYLGGHEQSAVFRTEYNGQTAAIKILPTDSGEANAQLSRWERAASLSHPHLIRLFETGRAELDDATVVYVVMEYAEEDLSQVVPERPLAREEAQQMLEATAKALAHIHDAGLIHAHLKPANIMAVRDQLKISSDGICERSERRGGSGMRSPYDAPELAAGDVSPASDIWSLGVMLVEALTQRAADRDRPLVPETLPAPFGEIARQCLIVDPQHRYTARDILAKLSGDTPAPEAVVSPAPPARRRFLVPAVILGLVILALLAIPRLLNRPETQPPPSVPVPPPKVEPKPEPPAPLPPAPQPPVAGKVTREVPPKVLQQALNTIQGRLRVSVSVQVDAAGKVVNAKLDSAGPSRYFAQAAMQAARRWEFAPPQIDGRPVASAWILRFAFRKSGTDVSVVQVKPRPKG